MLTYLWLLTSQCRHHQLSVVHAIRGMGNYGRGALSNNRHRAVGSHALWGHGHLWARCSSQRPALGRLFARPLGVGEVLFSKTGPGPSVRMPSGAWAPMGELLFRKTGPGPSVRTPSGGMGTYGRGALSRGHAASHHSRQGRPAVFPSYIAGRADLRRHKRSDSQYRVGVSLPLCSSGTGG
jgi:hypothetical protein